MCYLNSPTHPSHAHQTGSLPKPAAANHRSRGIARKSALLRCVPHSLRLHLRFATGLCSLTAFLCAATIIFSRGIAVPDNILDVDITHCGQLTCFRGLTPGQTTWTDAMAAFHGEWLVIDDPSYATITLSPGSDEQNLNLVVLHLLPNVNIFIGTIIARYGTPACVDIFGHAETISLRYPQMRVSSRFSGNRINAYSKVTSISISSHQKSTFCSPSLPNASRDVLSHHLWQGFATIDHYLVSDIE